MVGVLFFLQVNIGWGVCNLFCFSKIFTFHCLSPFSYLRPFTANKNWSNFQFNARLLPTFPPNLIVPVLKCHVLHTRFSLCPLDAQCDEGIELIRGKTPTLNSLLLPSALISSLTYLAWHFSPFFAIFCCHHVPLTQSPPSIFFSFQTSYYAADPGSQVTTNVCFNNSFLIQLLW